MASYLDFFPQELQTEEEQEQDEVEEALSLSDLPLNHDVTKKCNGSDLDDTSSRQSRRSSLSEAVDLFEFFNDTSSSDMCSADDIVFCGKLFKDTDRSFPMRDMKDLSTPPVYRRRSESLSILQSGVTRSNSAIASGNNSRRFMMRNSRSMDYRRLHRSSSSIVMPAAEIERNSSVRSVVQSEIVVKKSMMKPRWFFLFFGIVRVPSEMELRDIKNRQFRRNPSMTMFPTADHSGKLSVNRSSGKMSWKILKALSCKDYNSVSVTTPFVAPQMT